MKGFCLLFALMCISYSARAATIEVITNGGFEAGNVGFTSEFTDLSPGLAFNPGTRSTTDPATNYFGVDAYDGDWMLAVAALDIPFVDLTVWAQDIWLDAGVAYEFSMWHAKATGVDQAGLAVRLNGGTFFSSFSGPNEDAWYGSFTSLGVATSGTYTLSIADVTDGLGVRFALDNISLTYEMPDAQVPLPAGGFLFLTALAGLAVFRRFTTQGHTPSRRQE